MTGPLSSRLSRRTRSRFVRAGRLSDDASRAIVGFGEGGARIFVRTDAAWTQEGILEQGGAVALSADGTIAAAGRAGFARVYAREGTTWSDHGSLVPFDGEPDDYFGEPVALSSDGTLALVGASLDDNGPSLRGGAKQPPVDRANTDAGSVRFFVVPAP